MAFVHFYNLTAIKGKGAGQEMAISSSWGLKAS